jgi:hypothetical protein
MARSGARNPGVRADKLAGNGHRCAVGGVRDAEVGDLDDASGGEQQVARLDVPVHQPGLVRRMQARRRLRHYVHRPGGIQRPGCQRRGQ